MCMTKETYEAYNNKWVKRDLLANKKKIKELQAELDKLKGTCICMDCGKIIKTVEQSKHDKECGKPKIITQPSVEDLRPPIEDAKYGPTSLQKRPTAKDKQIKQLQAENDKLQRLLKESYPFLFRSKQFDGESLGPDSLLTRVFDASGMAEELGQALETRKDKDVKETN